MVEVRLSEERDASVRRSSLHGIGPNTVRRGTAPQPVLTSDKRLYIERRSVSQRKTVRNRCVLSSRMNAVFSPSSGKLSQVKRRGFCGLFTLWLLSATDMCDTLSLGFTGSKPRHITYPLRDIT